MKQINIKKEWKIKTVNTYKEILDPNYVYIKTNNENIKIGKRILKNSEIDNKVYTPISGIISDIVKINNQDYIKIENDFIEEEINILKNNKFSVEEMMFYLPKTKEILENDIVYINLIDEEPYSFNHYYNFLQENDRILDAVEILKKVYKVKKVIFVIASSSEKIINILNENACNYKIVSDIYPIGNDIILKKYLGNKNVIISLEILLSIYSLYQKKQPITEKYVTINGNAINEGIVLKIKNYTMIKDYLNLVEFKSNEYEIILNNSLCGKIVDENMIIDSNVKNIIINVKNKQEEGYCNKCGMCINACPQKINPLNPNSKCIKCGLCNYVCPMKINLVKENI